MIGDHDGRGKIYYQPGRGYPCFETGEESPIPHIITLNCVCYGGKATVHAPVIQTGVQAQVDFDGLEYGNQKRMNEGMT